MATSSIKPPFAWLGKATTATAVAGVIAVGAFLRFWDLGSLPPGLTDSSARVGLQALDLIEKGITPALSAANDFAPIWVWLQALSIKLLGHTDLALRLWPALLGSLAVVTTWLWAKSWFGARTGWLAAFFLAVSPWAITLSRGGLEAAAYPLLVTLTLWLATRAWRVRNLGNQLLLVGVLGLNLLCGPLGWWLAGGVILTGIVQLIRSRQFSSFGRAQAVSLTAFAIVLAGASYIATASLTQLKTLPQATSLVTSLGQFGSNLLKTLLMFNVYGDENYRHNLSGLPLLNAFVGLMLIAGLLVSIARLHERRYRLLLAFTLIMLLPAIMTTVGIPNAARAVGVLPLIMVMAAVGTSYMLELWYTTFPINSAARAVGQSVIIVLLGLTAFQGYTQYFRAWAGTAEVYAAYHEGATQMAERLKTDKFTGQRFIVGTPAEQTVVQYLNHNQTVYQSITAADIAGLPIATGPRQFTIAGSSRLEAAKTLKLKFPGGVLRPHYSAFNQTEIYYSYEVAK